MKGQVGRREKTKTIKEMERKGKERKKRGTEVKEKKSRKIIKELKSSCRLLYMHNWVNEKL